jgi:hypothetical protein
MVALGIVLSLDPLPRNLGLGRSFGLAIAIGFGYWLALGLTSSLDRSAIIPAWLPNFTFATIAPSIFLFDEERCRIRFLLSVLLSDGSGLHRHRLLHAARFEEGAGNLTNGRNNGLDAVARIGNHEACCAGSR